MFEDTFGLSLKANSPYTMAEQLGMTEKQLDSMVDAEPWHPLFDNE